MLLTPSDSAIREESEAYERWLHMASLEEGFLKQRAKLHWLDVGDQNNKTFHNAIRSRHRSDDYIVKKKKDIKNETTKFFSEFLNRSPTNYQGVTEEELHVLLGFRFLLRIVVC